MGNFFALIIFALIGSIFGKIGFFIGVGIGIWVWVSNGKDKPKRDVSSVAKNPLPNRTPSVESEIFNSQVISASATEYKDALVCFYATLLSMYPATERKMVNSVTELIKQDDWIDNKYEMLDDMLSRLKTTQSERESSPMKHQLHSNLTIERILRLPKSMKSSLALQIETLLDNTQENPHNDGNEYISQTLKSLRKEIPVSSQRLEAENLIIQSGDKQAISALRAMKGNPHKYQEMLKLGAQSNNVLKTAFGVFAGILAAEAVKAAVSDYQKQQLLSKLDDQIQGFGGLESIEVENDELANISEALPHSQDESSSQLSDDFVDIEEFDQAGIENNVTDVSLKPEDEPRYTSGNEVSYAETEVDTDDIDDEISFDFDD